MPQQQQRCVKELPQSRVCSTRSKSFASCRVLELDVLVLTNVGQVEVTVYAWVYTTDSKALASVELPSTLVHSIAQAHCMNISVPAETNLLCCRGR